MLGCDSPAADWASARKRARSAGEACSPPQDHLERHEALQARLPGLVHHAHAAAAQLLHQLVLAESARRGSGRPGERAWAGLLDGGLGIAAGACQLHHLGHVQQVPQLVNEVGVLARERVPVGLLPLTLLEGNFFKEQAQALIALSLGVGCGGCGHGLNPE